MEILKTADGDKLTFTVKGCLDTTTSPDLQSEIEAMPPSVRRLVFDFAALEYISSAGLRVMLMSNKRMAAAGGSMVITGLNPSVREVFDMTGFSDIFEIA